MIKSSASFPYAYLVTNKLRPENKKILLVSTVFDLLLLCVCYGVIQSEWIYSGLTMYVLMMNRLRSVRFSVEFWLSSVLIALCFLIATTMLLYYQFFIVSLILTTWRRTMRITPCGSTTLTDCAILIVPSCILFFLYL